MLTLTQLESYEAMSARAADILTNALRQDPQLVLCLASGSTPALMCDLFVQQVIRQQIPVEGLTFIGLDEWVGLPPENTGSCRYFFQHKIIRPLGLFQEQVHLFDGMATDLERECRVMDDVILADGIDIMVVGIGMNGHIGFNEPGTPTDIHCHMTDLEEVTRSVGQKYFTEATELDRGITVGLGHLMKAKQLILMANGAHKKDVVEAAVHGPVHTGFPASIVQLHTNALVLTDKLGE